MKKKKVYLGKIISTHGLKGLLKIEFYNKDTENLKITLIKLTLITSR